MNGKRAKSLRRIAQGFYQNTPVADYEPKQPVLIEINPVMTRLGKVAIFTGVQRLVKECQRSLYQDIKAQFKRGQVTA